MKMDTVFLRPDNPRRRLYVRTHYEYVLRIGSEYGLITSTAGFSHLEKTENSFTVNIPNDTYDWVNLLNQKQFFEVQWKNG